jgi:CRP/FNR family cyclic AMP-dependent transcriptional regulator
MKEQSLWYAENIDLDSVFKADKSIESAFEGVKKFFKKGEYIYLPEEKSDRIYFVLSGKIKIGTYRDGDKEIITAILERGDVFGEISILKDQKRKDFGFAAEESSLAVFTLDILQKLMHDLPALSMLMMKLMGDRVMEMEGKLESLVFNDSKTRIIEFLVNSIRKKGQRVGYEWVLRNFLTHQDIASLTATSRQTVTMILNELRSENIIQFDRKRLLVRDLEKLHSLISKK